MEAQDLGKVGCVIFQRDFLENKDRKAEFSYGKAESLVFLLNYICMSLLFRK
jgi:hypothetical protein